MPKQTLPQVITPKNLTEFFEEEPPAIIGKKLVRFSDRPGFLLASYYERETFKLDRNGDPLPLDLDHIDTTDYLDTLSEGYALSDDEDLGLSLDDLDMTDLEAFSSYTS